MEQLKEIIESANKEQIQELLMKVIARYQELFPQWEISLISLEKNGDRNDQIKAMIQVLEKMKQ